MSGLLRRSGAIVLRSRPDLDDAVVALADELVARGIRPTILVDAEISQVRAAKRWNYDVTVLLRRSVGGLRAHRAAPYVFTTSQVLDERRRSGQVVVALAPGTPGGPARLLDRLGIGLGVARVPGGPAVAQRRPEGPPDRLNRIA
jgi:hypothetical protein